MPLRLSGRVVVVTGASSGIGHATATRVAAEGAAVVASARRADRLEALAQQIRSAGGRAIGVVSDVTDESDMRRLVARTVETFGRIDVMICNAGIGYHGPFDETSADVMRRVVDVNLMGTFYAAHAALRAMRQQGSGHIVAVSSIVGRRGIGGSSIYSATKAAQVGFVEALRAEFYGTPFHASVIFPVSTETEFRDAIERDFGHAVSGAGPRQSADEVAKRIADCIASPKAVVYTYRTSWWLALLNVVAPAKADWFVQRFTRRRKAHVPPTNVDPHA